MEIKNIPIKFVSIQVIDKKTNEIISWGNNAVVRYDSVGIVPFFNWLHWQEFPDSIQSNSEYTKVEHKTINP